MSKPVMAFDGAWPPDYKEAYKQRCKRIIALRNNPGLLLSAKEYYRQPGKCAEWIEDFCITFDPRVAGGVTPSIMPFLMFKRQREFIDFIFACLLQQEGGLVEKCRDMGATWLCCAISVYLWLFWAGASIGWGSRKQDLVDRLGDADSIFEKIRMIIDNLPREMWPRGFNPRLHMSKMRIFNPENNSSITGEVGDNIGRGGRKLIYFKDESAHYEHPETIEAALSDNTRVPIDISSVNGVGNVFHRRRENGVDWLPGQPAVKGKTNVFVFDYSDHPLKTKEWYDLRRRKAVDDGLLHIFAQEVERNYEAAKAGVIIPKEWIRAAIDAHIKLDIPDDGMWGAGLDIADNEDEGDKNGLVTRKGIILKSACEWGDRDTGVTTRRTIEVVEPLGPIEVQYDCIGIGSGVKAEINRLKDEWLLPRHVNFVPWNAGGELQDPEGHVEPFDEDTPLNKDFYGSRKSQGWWRLRRRFEKTFRALNEGIKYNHDELISIDSTIPFHILDKLVKELSQPTASKGARLKLIIDKKPDGTRSPNMGDATMMAYDPQETSLTTWLKLAGQ